ncbi:MAG TPA: hypothetical protein VIJ34_09425 [Acidimicrobiales bacterium]
MVTQKLNTAQRTITVIGLGLGLCIVGGWIMSWGSSIGFLGSTPLTPSATYSQIPVIHEPFFAVHPWAQFLTWLGLLVIWVVCSIFVFKSPDMKTDGSAEGADS